MRSPVLLGRFIASALAENELSDGQAAGAGGAGLLRSPLFTARAAWVECRDRHGHLGIPRASVT